MVLQALVSIFFLSTNMDTKRNKGNNRASTPKGGNKSPMEAIHEATSPQILKRDATLGEVGYTTPSSKPGGTTTPSAPVATRTTTGEPLEDTKPDVSPKPVDSPNQADSSTMGSPPVQDPPPMMDPVVTKPQELLPHLLSTVFGADICQPITACQECTDDMALNG